MEYGRVVYKSFGGDLMSQLISIKQGGDVVALSRGEAS